MEQTAVNCVFHFFQKILSVQKHMRQSTHRSNLFLLSNIPKDICHEGNLVQRNGYQRDVSTVVRSGHH